MLTKGYCHLDEFQSSGNYCNCDGDDCDVVADNGLKMHAAGLLGQRAFKENSKWRKKMVRSLDNFIGSY